MRSHFEITFPLVLDCDGSMTIVFELEDGGTLEFTKGVYYLSGDNGSGKTSFVNMLALLAGQVGCKKTGGRGTITFNGEMYNGEGIDYIRAAEIREKYFCIFPQRVFFLPVSTHDNYLILNGLEKEKAKLFSSREFPDMLSGGQQQKILMDIVLDHHKPVWFLDEPLTNMDAEKRHYFWKTLRKAFEKGVESAFYIDHWITPEIEEEEDFRYYATLRVSVNNPMEGPRDKAGKTKTIRIFENSSPSAFFEKQVGKFKKESRPEK